MDEPENNAGSARLLALPALFLCVFGVSAMILTRVVPGPLKELDYMVIGTVAVMAGILAVFAMVIRSAKAGDQFFKRKQAFIGERSSTAHVPVNIGLLSTSP